MNCNLELLEFRGGFIKILLNNHFYEDIVLDRVININTQSNSNYKLMNYLLHAKFVDQSWKNTIINPTSN